MKNTKNTIITIILFVLPFIYMGQAQAAIIIDGSTAQDIDTDPASVIGLNIFDTGNILDLNVAIEIEGGEGAGTAYWTDWVITLSHNSTVITLFDQTSQSSMQGFFEVVFDDDTGVPVPTGSDDLVGTFIPDSLLSAFDGQELSGLWELSIYDGVFPNDGDDLLSWSLIAEVGVPDTAVPEPSILSLFALGLLGLGFAGRRQAA